MKELLRDALTDSLKSLEEQYDVDLSTIKIEVKENKEKDFGDFSTNLALVLSKKLSEQPKKIAEILLGELDKKEFIDSIEIAGPGFINFFLSQTSRTEILKTVNKEKNKFGFSQKKEFESDKILIEYVSSNPTCLLYTSDAADE